MISAPPASRVALAEGGDSERRRKRSDHEPRHRGERHVAVDHAGGRGVRRGLHGNQLLR